MRRAIVAVAVAVALIGAPALMTPAQAQTTAPAATTTAKPKKPLSAGQQAMRERQRKCGGEWKAAKAAGKVEKGMTWPKFWSACNKRLKAGG